MNEECEGGARRSASPPFLKGYMRWMVIFGKEEKRGNASCFVFFCSEFAAAPPPWLMIRSKMRDF